MMREIKFRNIDDIEEFETTPIEERLTAFNTYEMIKNGAAIDPEEIGLVCIKGPNVFKGYLDEAHNCGTWPKEGWLNTGIWEDWIQTVIFG
jgi:acyl-CoA synthetase (AMP-forming)/AMP-acid ligase II